MTDFTLPRRKNRIATMAADAGKTISQMLESLRAGLEARDAFDRYSMMSESELTRRGLKREEIPYLVMRRYLSADS